jgi:hypothetical protein
VIKNRLNKLGIKQVIRIEWMDRTLSLVLSGMSVSEIRQDLDVYLSDKKQSGGIGERGKKTYSIAIGLLSSWFDPEKDLIGFRDRILSIASRLPQAEWLPLHWAIMIAAYPFWFNVAIQTGRLLALQDKITQKQIFDRVVEQYGERSTVLRNARYTVRSFIAWGVLQDTEIKGKYKKAEPQQITDLEIIEVLVEAALLSIPNHKARLDDLLNSPAFYPLYLYKDNFYSSSQNNSNLHTYRLGGSEVYTELKDKPIIHNK